jgi:hypothetical protein
MELDISPAERLALAVALRGELTAAARRGETVRYAALAEAAGVPGPHAIHKTGELLETLAAEDAAAGRPLLSALAVSKHGDVPAPGFFMQLKALGRYQGPERGPEAAAAHARELQAALEYWGKG